MATVMATGEPPTPNPGNQMACDPIDPSLCMLPWPDNFYTRPDPSTPTGLRLNVSPAATPKNVAGVPIDPTDWNRLDGFSPGSPIVTHVPGIDNAAGVRQHGRADEHRHPAQP